MSPASVAAQLKSHGVAGPVSILSDDERREWIEAARRDEGRRPLDWHKGWGARSPAFYDLATHPTLLSILTNVLGEDVILWGAYIRTQPPGGIHPWHTDIESAAVDGRTVSVWIGLENTARASGLRCMSHSHTFGETVQEAARAAGKRREETTTEDVLAWARDRNPACEVVQPEVGDGDALLFDGRVWHGSHNELAETRRAVILHYATPDTPIRIPDFRNLTWPFVQRDHPRPACVLVSGSARGKHNRIVAPPERSGLGSLSNRADVLGVPLSLEPPATWRPYPIFAGSTAGMKTLSCHVSALRPGYSPHPPHAHEEEEILIVLCGEVDISIPDETPDRRRLSAGELVYYPAEFPHTIEAVGESVANYLMFKWNSAHPKREASSLPFHRIDVHARTAEGGEGFVPRLAFEGPTRHLAKLHCHTSTLSPGAGYDPHADPYDVAILILEGEVETLGERFGPFTVLFHAAGDAHGIRNPGDVPARYVVFEFHARA